VAPSSALQARLWTQREQALPLLMLSFIMVADHHFGGMHTCACTRGGELSTFDPLRINRVVVIDVDLYTIILSYTSL